MRSRLQISAAVFLIAATTACGSRPAAPAADTPFRILVLSDLNSSYGSTSYGAEVGQVIERAVHGWRPDLVLIAGDMIAGQRTTLSDERVRSMWAAFDSVGGAPLRRAGIPLGFTMGNHDGSGHPGHERDRRLAAAHWRDPAHDPGLRLLDGGNYPFYYAFTAGDIFVLVMDASTGTTFADSAQVAWMRRTLAREEARGARLRLSLGHVPLHAVAHGRDRPGEIQQQPDSLRAVLEAGGVELHVTGHHHAYFPGRRGDLDLLHAGALGGGPRQLIGSEAEPHRTVTLLDFFPARDSLAERTYRVEDGALEQIDPAALPRRIDGPNGYVLRRQATRPRDAP